MSDRWSMSLRFPVALVLSTVCLATPAWADFKAGEKAYDRGDYATALREWQPLAKQGQAVAHSSSSAGRPSQSKWRIGQHTVPAATPLTAVTWMNPVQPGGMGLGAGDRSSFTSVTAKPAHSPVTLHGAPTGQSVLRTWM